MLGLVMFVGDLDKKKRRKHASSFDLKLQTNVCGHDGQNQTCCIRISLCMNVRKE